MVMGEFTQETQVLVIGGGPGGYAAAFRAADLGLDVTLVEREDRLGGVCLKRGCIPSKALLHMAELIEGTRWAATVGVTFGDPEINLDQLRSWKDGVIDRLTGGLGQLAQKRGVQVIKGRAQFESSDAVHLVDSELSHIKFKQAIIATGSRPAAIPGVEFKPKSRIVSSTGALMLPEIPESLLVIGGGYIGAELGQVYAALGSKVSVVIRSDRMLRAADEDLVKPLIKHLKKKVFRAIYFNTKIKSVEEKEDRVDVVFDGEADPAEQSFSMVLIATGRRANSGDLGLENTKIKVNDKGFIQVDGQMRTDDPNIFAIGDVVGEPMLAHKAMREGKVAAEVIAGEPAEYDVRAMPAVVYTEPQIAWTGLSEEEAKKQGREVNVARFPWGASGRALTMGAAEGMTKLIIDPETERILGVGVVGREAESLIAEGTLAIEMGAVAEDLALTVHPHPTLSETEGEAAEVFLGKATDVFSPKKKKK